jgi:hypothetical protein
MHLSRFILDNIEPIVAEWKAFAATLLPAAAGMTELELRNDARHILEAVAKNLTTAQTDKEQEEKSKGRSPCDPDAAETAAQTHAVLRAKAGFDINQLVAEYRALRASVLRLWTRSNPGNGPDVEQLVRFNEAIDQAIAESVGHFHTQMTRARNLLLGMLGHDMRTPLGAIVHTAQYLNTLSAGEDVSKAAKRLIHSGEAMQDLLNDLVDFNRTQLGTGIRIHREDSDLAIEIADEIEQLRGAHPDREIELVVTGNTRGRWDGGRLQQVLRNLVENAVRYGSQRAPVRVNLFGEERGIRLEVTNSGPAIDPSARKMIFDPLQRRLTEPGSDPYPESLGLGLFVVRAVAEAHGGRVDLLSDGRETTFALCVPRQ